MKTCYSIGACKDLLSEMRRTLLLNVVMCSINIGHIIACYYTTQLVLWHHNHLIVPSSVIEQECLRTLTSTLFMEFSASVESFVFIVNVLTDFVGCQLHLTGTRKDLFVSVFRTFVNDQTSALKSTYQNVMSKTLWWSCWFMWRIPL